MGLGAPRKFDTVMSFFEVETDNNFYRRVKISHDPNNTIWSQSTTSYGHKILLSQGWTPGSLLGATNAPHAHFHSNASASHIRVAIKDDNLGLGAKRGTVQSAGECTGLDDLQSLLGRLNGKSEAILDKEQKTRDDLKRAAYATRKFGALGFVSGGVLVGDRILELVEGERARLAHQNPPSLTHNDSIALQNGLDPPSGHGQCEPLRVPLDMAAGTSNFEAHATGPAERDSKLKSFGQRSEKEIIKARKAQRKLDRRKQKDARGVLPGYNHMLPNPPDRQVSQTQTLLVDIPAGPIQAIGTAFGGRHAVRQRYIQQKKMAVMDPKALNEVCLPLY